MQVSVCVWYLQHVDCRLFQQRRAEQLVRVPAAGGSDLREMAGLFAQVIAGMSEMF